MVPEGEKYDDTKESSYLTYLDANNLYGWAMLQSLPTGDYQWVEEWFQWNESKIKALDPEGPTGYMFEVDLEYPVELHDMHNDYPLAPERFAVREEMLSDYSKELLKKLGLKIGDVQKLIPNLMDKECYVVHYRTLQLYLSLGLKLKKVHRVLQFRQEKWMSKYIEKNTYLRGKAKNEFEKAFYKLMNNAVFGKTLENVRNRIDFKFVTAKEEELRAAAHLGNPGKHYCQRYFAV